MSDIVATLRVENIFYKVPDTAEGHPAVLQAQVQVSAVKTVIEVPVVGSSGSAARQEFLSKVEVLEVNVIPIGLDFADEEVELVSNSVLEVEGQDPSLQLQEDDEAEEHGEELEQEDVLSGNLDAAGKTQH